MSLCSTEIQKGAALPTIRHSPETKAVPLTIAPLHPTSWYSAARENICWADAMACQYSELSMRGRTTGDNREDVPRMRSTVIMKLIAFCLFRL